MLRLSTKPTHWRGGVIASVVEVADPEYTVTLDTGEIIVTSDVPVADLDVDDWLVYKENSANDYGVSPTWEAITKEEFAEWMRVVGG